MEGLRTPEDWGEEYRRNFSAYLSYKDKLRGLLVELLHANGLDFDNVEGRPKTVESFINKIKRDPSKYANPLEDISDLVGLRVITYYRETVSRIGGMIEKEFEVNWDKSERKMDILDPDQFGYLSDHYVVKLSESRKSLVEWKDFADLNAEIQVRTVLQHAWASISHKLQYKSEVEVPKDLRRQLNSLSALMEVADSYFSDLRNRTETLIDSYKNGFRTGDLDVELNSNSIELYATSKALHSKWIPIAEKTGFESLEESEQVTRVSMGVLLRILSMIGLEKIKDLDEILRGADSWGEKVLEHVHNISKEEECICYAVLYDIITLFAMYARRTVVDEEIISETKFNAGMLRAIREFDAIT